MVLFAVIIGLVSVTDALKCMNNEKVASKKKKRRRNKQNYTGQSDDMNVFESAQINISDDDALMSYSIQLADFDDDEDEVLTAAFRTKTGRIIIEIQDSFNYEQGNGITRNKELIKMLRTGEVMLAVGTKKGRISGIGFY